MSRPVASRLAAVLVAFLLGLGAPLLACQQEDNDLSDKAKDALDMREHEKLKDAGEDVKDAGEDAGNAVKDEAEELKEKAK